LFIISPAFNIKAKQNKPQVVHEEFILFNMCINKLNKITKRNFIID